MELLTLQDAMELVAQIEKRFHDQPMIFTAFLNIMHSYKLRIISGPEVGVQVTKLFAGYNETIAELSRYIPNMGDSFDYIGGNLTTNSSILSAVPNTFTGYSDEFGYDIAELSTIDTFTCTGLRSANNGVNMNGFGNRYTQSVVSVSNLNSLVFDPVGCARDRNAVMKGFPVAANRNATHKRTARNDRKPEKPAFVRSVVKNVKTLPVIHDITQPSSEKSRTVIEDGRVSKRARKERHLYDPGVPCTTTFYAAGTSMA